jgi:glycine dehydrogenase
MAEILLEELSIIDVSVITKKGMHFDTLTVDCKKSGFSSSDYLLAEFHKFGINLRKVDENLVGISFNETSTIQDLTELIEIFADLKGKREA